VERLEAAGVPVVIGHEAANVPDRAEVIVSSAIAPDNPEISGRDVRRRGELLAELLELRPAIVVAGAPGKTTTSAMIAFSIDVRGPELEPVALELAVPGEHNRRNAAVALATLELAGVERSEAERVLAEFRGVGRRFEPRGEAGGVRVFDDYGHNPTKVAATLEAARAVADGGRVLVLFQPHLY